MNDLDGETAFDKVLEAAMEARADVRIARDSETSAIRRTQQAEELLRSTQGQLMQAKAETRDALPLLSELWLAAQNALDTLSSQGIPDAEQARKRLKDALGKAAINCDQIPF